MKAKAVCVCVCYTLSAGMTPAFAAARTKKPHSHSKASPISRTPISKPSAGPAEAAVGFITGAGAAEASASEEWKSYPLIIPE